MASSPTPLNLLEFCRSHAAPSAAQIHGFEGEPSVVQRLQEIGLHHGIQIGFLGQAPFHGPMLFRIGPTVVALREEEAGCLIVNPL